MARFGGELQTPRGAQIERFCRLQHHVPCRTQAFMGGVEKILCPPQPHQHKPVRIEADLRQARRIEFT